MISRLHRFHGHGSLNFVYRNGTTIRGESISLRLVTARQPDYRLAVVVSKKVHKSAVVRNKIRRRIFEVVRTYHKEQGQQWPYDIVITVFDDRSASASHQDNQKTIQQLLIKASL